MLQYIWRCIWTQNSFKMRCYLLAAMFVVLISVFINLSVPFFLKQIIMQLSNTKSYVALSVLVLVIIYATFWYVSQILRSIMKMTLIKPVAAGTLNFSLNLFRHLQDLSIRYHMDRKTGGILSAYKQIHYAYSELIMNSLSAIVPLMLEAILTVSILTYYYSVYFGVALLLMFILYNLLVYYTSNYIADCRKIQNRCNLDANAYIVDGLLNAETVKLLNTQDYEAEKALVKLRAKEDADFKMLNTDAKIHLGQNLIVGITLMFMIIVAGLQVWQNKITISDFIFIYGFIFIFMEPLSMLGYKMRQARDYITRLQLALDILAKPIEIQDLPNASDLRINAGDIRFEHVSFSYNPDREVIHDISFEVLPGKTVAIVGATGSGKSTISRLLLRLYNVSSGKITIDNQNIAEITEGSLRESIGIVPQDSILFNEDLRANIAYGKLNCSEDELQAVIKEAELDSFIEKLPNRLATIVGERGLRLSGGEKQRVAIARMLIKKPSIMVFDEATSSLDVHIERQIQNNIRKISKNMSTIIIAHRLSTITYADLILVMDHGEIKERGTHEDLLAQNGIYAGLWRHQLEESRVA